METQGKVPGRGREVFTAAQNTACSGSVPLDSASCTTGMLEAEYLITSGGVMPGGSCRTCVCTAATVWAIADWMLTLGWKNTLMTEMPGSEVDSICSISLTVVVRPRSLEDAMRCPISCAGSPL